MLEKATMTSSHETTRESWDAYWQHYEAANYINHIPQLIETLRKNIDLRGSVVLEIGAGTGGNSSTLARLGCQVIALDWSRAALERTRVTAVTLHTDLLIVQADAFRLPFDTSTFDLVFHQGFLEHFIDPASLVREQRRVLKLGGYLLVDVPQRYNWYTVSKHRLIRAGRWPYGGWEREFSLRELTVLLQDCGFRHIEAYGWGYYPRLLEMVRNLSKIEKKLFRRDRPPSSLWRRYDAGWRRFERTRLGCNTLQCVGVLAQAEGGT